MRITIAGLGPRGLAICLYALARGLDVTAYDPAPLSSWDVPNMLPHFQLRSPLTFDLVVGEPSLQHYSFRTYMGLDSPVLSQEEVEAYPIRPTRGQAHAYFLWLWDLVRERIDWRPTTCPPHIIPTVDATGSGDFKLPGWVVGSHILHYVVEDQTLSGQQVLVIGSGQGAAEWVLHLLAQGNRVCWVRREARIAEYPIPGWGEWGARSALGIYYHSLNNLQRTAYLKAVRRWQPSITPDVAQQLAGASFEKVTPHQALNRRWDAVVLATGRQSTQHDLKSFRRRDGVYITGVGAILHDGARQGSLISAGPTARVIIGDIVHHV